MEIQKEIKELREKLESLEKQISSKKEFAKGWNYMEVINAGFRQEWLVLNPSIVKDVISTDISIYLKDNTLLSRGTYALCCLDELKSHRPATPEEIKDVLVKVCERMGVKEGATVSRKNIIGHLEDVTLTGLKSWPPQYSVGPEELQYCGCLVYKQGQFATVVKEEEIKIGGYEVKFSSNGQDVSIDGVEYSHPELKAIQYTLNKGQVKYLAVGCSAQYKVTLDTINAILKRLEK